MKLNVSNEKIYSKLIEVHADMKFIKKLMWGAYGYITFVLAVVISNL